MIALIPSRAGSKRCPGKALRLLRGHPVIAYTIAAAQQSGVFDRIVVCSDDPAVLAVSPCDQFHRDPVADDQADVKWVRAALHRYPAVAFAILRPTSPFRTVHTIRRAYAQFQTMKADSLRAVELAPSTPFKMWVVQDGSMTPLLGGCRADGVPYHSCPTQDAPPVYLQNSSLEMSWSRNATEFGTLHGQTVAPFVTAGHEGLSIDTEADFAHAVALADAHPELLPALAVASVSPVSPDVDTSDTCWAV